MSLLRAILRIVALVLMSLVLAPTQYLVSRFYKSGPIFFFLPVLYNRLAAFLLGLRIRQSGRPSTARPVLYVGNHVGYLDIVVLSACTDAFFLAKYEVSTWPVFGLLAKLRGTRFIRRDARHVRAQRSALQDDFDAGLPMILFPEGTSTSGLSVRPFKSSLFEAVVSATKPVVVQPFVLFYDSHDGQPIQSMQQRQHVAWFNDIDLVPHFWGVLKQRRIDCRLIWLPPQTVAPGTHRKHAAEAAEAPVRALVAAEYPDGLDQIAAFGDPRA